VQDGFDGMDNAASTINAIGAGSTPTPVASLPTHMGGGPRLATQPHVLPAIAIAMALIGLAMLGGGAALLHYCGIKDHVAQDGSKKGCLGVPKLFWIVLAVLMMAAGTVMFFNFFPGALSGLFGDASANFVRAGVAHTMMTAVTSEIEGVELASISETLGSTAFADTASVIEEESILDADFASMPDLEPITPPGTP
jgi:hypothetical protein